MPFLKEYNGATCGAYNGPCKEICEPCKDAYRRYVDGEIQKQIDQTAQILAGLEKMLRSQTLTEEGEARILARIEPAAQKFLATAEDFFTKKMFVKA